MRRPVAFLQKERCLKSGETDNDTEIGIAWLTKLSRLANIADDIPDCMLSAGDLFYEVIRTAFGATLHTRHARQHTPRTSFRPDLFDNEESTKQKAEGCVYAKIAKDSKTHEIFPTPLYLLRALLLEVSYYYVGRSSQMVLYRHFKYYSLHAQAGFVHELAVAFLDIYIPTFWIS